MKAQTDEQRAQLLDRELAEADKQGGRPTYPVEIRGQVKNLSVFRIDISVPKFRLENGRTIRGIQEFTHDNPASAEALRDKSSAEAQDIIQSVLMMMVDKEDLIKILAEEGQRDPLILTQQGYVLNGNRRLAAMRKLSQDAKHSRRFQNIDVVLLPQLDEPELSSIEMRLQMAIEGKARYNWLDELLVIQKNIRVLNMDIEKVRVAMRTTKPNLLKRLLMYELVAEYLEFSGKPGQFFSVVSDEQAFKTLADGVKRYEKRVDMQRSLKSKAFEIILRKPKHKSIHLQISDLIRVLPELQGQASESKSTFVATESTDPLAGLSEPVPDKAKAPISEAEFSAQQKEIAQHSKTQELNDARNKQLRLAEDALSMINAIDLELASHHKARMISLLEKIRDASSRARKELEAGE
jgi:hypothetical protein